MAAASLAEQIAARSTAAREQAAREWRALCAAAAAGDVPELAAVEDLGRLIGIRQEDAAAEFESDVSALVEHPKHLAQAAATFAAIDRNLAPYEGDMARVAAALNEAELAIAELRRLASGTPWLMQSANISKANAARLAERHPRVFGEGGQ